MKNMESSTTGSVSPMPSRSVLRRCRQSWDGVWISRSAGASAAIYGRHRRPIGDTSSAP